MELEAETIKAIDNLNAAAKLTANAAAQLEARMKNGYEPMQKLDATLKALLTAIVAITPDGSPERRVADAMMADGSLPW